MCPWQESLDLIKGSSTMVSFTLFTFKIMFSIYRNQLPVFHSTFYHHREHFYFRFYEINFIGFCTSTWFSILLFFLISHSIDRRNIFSNSMGPILTGFGSYNMVFDSLAVLSYFGLYSPDFSGVSLIQVGFRYS